MSGYIAAGGGWTIEQWSLWVTWGLSGLWLALVIRCWLLVRYHASRLASHAEVLESSYRGDVSHPQPFLDPLKHLQAEGWRASSSLSKQDMIAYWRATAQTDKQRMSSYVEMMPQIGLLGTVLSLFFSAFLFEFNMTMLGLALVTTVFGLTGALWARASFELPSEKDYFGILELLQNEQVVQQLIRQVEHLAEQQEKQAIAEPTPFSANPVSEKDDVQDDDAEQDIPEPGGG
jgi:hypothetical protein